MATIPLSEVPARLDLLVDQSALEPIFLESKSECVAVMISHDRYELLMDALETLEDIASLNEVLGNELESDYVKQEGPLIDLNDPANAELVAEVRKELGLD
ncbi:MAG: type II toxin-antitoxin system Phd/YefM family antitoxin [Candidatus Nanopelagicales bacterium]|nr:type II toxin-antitoxin system Phd/YefM family antitoxin [Candidatus Nanopelagicales bacterium]